MKKRGFTLIELLAVIVILAIIALIAVPTILNIINNAQKSAFKDSVYGIIKSGELYYTDRMMETDGMTEDKTFTFPEADGLEIKGSKPASGTMIVTKEGRIGIAVSNGKYCAKKGYASEEITIDEDINHCTIPVESVLNPNISSENDCVRDINATCANGTEVTVQVNSDTNYNFYVIKDTGSELTLIMDRNLGSKVMWYETLTNTNGPLTALEELESETINWTNVPTISYTLNDDGEGIKYQSIIRTNVRARMLTYTEASNLGCTTLSGDCSNYLYVNLSMANTIEKPGGFWLSSADSETYSNAWIINFVGSILASPTNNSIPIGVRPVIVLTKIL